MDSQSDSTPVGSVESLHPYENDLTKMNNILPHERVFPVQIGTELFKLSGASLSSDAPSYFSQYFRCQMQSAEDNGEDPNTAIRTLYIDRDPVTFRDIALHLQGYHVQPRDGTHFVRLFADAQFYSLPKLISQLYEESIFMSIGHREFQIPRDSFSDPGNSPNFFSLGFAIFFSNPEDLFPGLDRDGLLRPPSILPPSVPNKSAEIFDELLHLLRGYPVNIRNEAHRAALLRDCRYFNFKGLEQKLIPHQISYNQVREKMEIVLRLEDILKSGISIANDPPGTPGDPLAGWVNYARPFVDETPAELVLEIRGETTKIHFTPGGPRAEFFRDSRVRVARLFEVIATKLSLTTTIQPLGLLMSSGGAASQPATPGNTPLSEDLVRVVIEPETAITLDGEPYVQDEDMLMNPAAVASSASSSNGYAAGLESPPVSMAALHLGGARKRRRIDSAPDSHPSLVGEAWTVRNAQWRLRIQTSNSGKSGLECVLFGVKMDALSSEHGRNAARSFLGG